MSDFDFLRIDKSSCKSLLRPANTQGYASSSINISVVKYRGFLPSPGANFISRFSLDSNSVSKEPGLMGRSSLVSSQSSISFNNSSRLSKRIFNTRNSLRILLFLFIYNYITRLVIRVNNNINITRTSSRDTVNPIL